MKESEYETADDCNSSNNPTSKGKGKDGDGDEGVDTQGKSSSLPDTDAGNDLSLGGFCVQPCLLATAGLGSDHVLREVI